MSGPAVVVSCTATLCWRLWRLTKAVGNFSYHLVSNLFRLAKEGWSAVFVFGRALGSASCDIGTYFYEFLIEFGCCFAVLYRIAAQLFILLTQLLLCLCAVVERVAVVVAELFNRTLR